MNYDNCKHYNWYYDYCNKWKCEIDEREKFIRVMNKGERMINDKNALPVLTKEQIAELGKGLSEDFTESLDRAERLFKKPPIGLKPRSIHRKERIDDILDVMERYAKAECLILPEWVDELRELINDN